MALYKLQVDGYGKQSILRHNEDGSTTVIPEVSTSQDYVDYLAWVAAGNTPDPANA